MRRGLIITLALTGCAAPEAAPETLQEASEVVLRDYEEDDLVTTRAQDFMDFVIAELEVEEAAGEPYLGRGLETVAPENVDDMYISENVDWEKVVGALLVKRVAGSLDDYAAVVPEPDQSFADPRTYNLWEREITEGTEADFLTRDAPLRTYNEIEKSGAFGVVIPYPMQKDYRWVELEQGRALLFRSWAVDEGWGEDGVNGLVSGWTIEVWLEDGEQTVWANASWTELALLVDVDPDWLANEFIAGCDDYYTGTENYVNGWEDER